MTTAIPINPTTLHIPRPDDWHLHIRDGAMMQVVLPYTARYFGRAIIMPNLRPPITTTEQAVRYRDAIHAVCDPAWNFTPLMTLYLTDTTDPDDITRGHDSGVVHAVKLYPANATTNSAHGVTNIHACSAVFERMQACGMPLLIHGEVTDPEVDIFDREAVFIDRVLIGLRRDFPDLKIVLEHITTREGVDWVRSESPSGRVAATLTAHHLRLNRNALFQGGLRPHHWCLPVLKREGHRQALVKAATSGEACFFLGTDSAPHPRQAKESDCGCAGVFSAPVALAVYAEVFYQEDKLANFAGFASRHGATFYGLPVAQKTLTLIRRDSDEDKLVPLKTVLTVEGVEITVFADSAAELWHIIEGD